MGKFSSCHVPAYPLEESIEIIRTADERGFYAAYSVDETWWKDMWLLFAAAADKTTQIRLGPNVTHVILRDPAHVVQMAATLDQLTNGRAEIVVSFGNISMLPQHGIDTPGMKPLWRVWELLDWMHDHWADHVLTAEELGMGGKEPVGRLPVRGPRASRRSARRCVPPTTEAACGSPQQHPRLTFRAWPAEEFRPGRR